TLVHENAGTATINLFGKPREIDFSLFKPRGHYDTETQQAYFRAMSWLAQIDFQIVDCDTHGKPTLSLQALAAAMLLRDAIAQAGQRAAWDELDRLLTGMVGQSDNITLPDLDRFLSGAGLDSPSAVLRYPSPDALLDQLLAGDYGSQRISGPIQR